MSANNNKFKLLNENECREVLKCAFKCEDSEIVLENFQIIPVSNPDDLGLLGEYFHLCIEAKIKNNSKKVKYFIKSAPITDELQIGLTEKFDFFPMETGLYRTLFKDMEKYKISKWHPDCYYARKDLLVMEDLRQQNYCSLSNSEIFSIDHLKIALKTMSIIHANSIIFEEKTGVNIGEKYGQYLKEGAVLEDCGWFGTGINAINAIAKIIPKYQNSEVEKLFSEKFMKSVNKMYEIVKASKIHRNSFCHRDLWAKNLLFQHESNNFSVPTTCILVDYQLCRYHPPAIDVLQLIYLNTNRKMREKHLNEFLKFYHDCLCANLKSAAIDPEKNNLSWEQFTSSCEYVKLVPLTLNAICPQLGYLPEGFLHDLRDKDSVGYNTIVTKDRNNFMLEEMNKNEKYKEHLLECTEEVVEYVMKMTL